MSGLLLKKRRRVLLCMIVGIALFIVIFFLAFGSRSEADCGDLNSIRGYERVLVRPGDTLDGLSSLYSSEYSHVSVYEYKSQIIRLNGLSSEYLKAGVYLLMPVSR